MHPLISRDTIERLLALGREQGRLTTENLAQALPIEAMTADEVALVVVHLEEAGVNVELDDSLLAQARSATPVERPAGEIVLPAEERRPNPTPKGEDAGALEAAPKALTRPSSLRSTTGVHWAVALAGALVLTLLLLAVYALG